ncbi:hypothetical protein Slin_1042 [Spirosoma linguale DSM 74]|uniref:Uncharacterized protein n=1 Tax=Spirosoma linguale (strain ATCC 33905 / DSM 74 / LMG 10896 / Claus 1) TaxID=504472 RepID=D2QJX1_SPILD|nr:hypothetical protein Slin_1042 [Spirosoma linguale DSM 74]
MNIALSRNYLGGVLFMSQLQGYNGAMHSPETVLFTVHNHSPRLCGYSTPIYANIGVCSF